MQCVSCGKNIPITAKVCPYCHRDTKASSDTHGAMCALAIVGAIVGYFIYGWLGAFIGGVIVGGIGGGIVFVKAQSKAGNDPARVKVVAHENDSEKMRNNSSLSQKPSQTHSERLITLNNLKNQGLITEEELKTRREKILSEI
ncbi:MAG: SHOCT domain-containing protein [Pontiellaceae bacterium]|nr:SHOCT domain-containing protein [Pontiellaceae bacterium]